MEIIWYGHACFRLKSRGISIASDPYDKSLGLSLPRLNANIVTVSHPTPHHNHVAGVKAPFRVIDSPGEYEIGGVFITGIHMSPPKQKKEAVKNITFVYHIDDIILCHLGDLAHIPSQNQVEDLENVDVLMVPVGDGQALNAAQAAEVISLIEPYIVIPMHYNLPNLTIKLDNVDRFLKEMGITNPETVETLKVTKSGLPQETQIILLEPKL